MRFLANKSQLLFIDVQEKLFPHIEDNLELESKLLTLIKGVKILGLPIVVSEQYKKGLGNTMAIFDVELQESRHDEKSTFSCMDDHELYEYLIDNKRNQILLCGIEAHVCVLQTALDLVGKGFEVGVIVDAIGSRDKFNKQIAIDRMRQEGVCVMTVESILFELCRDSKHPKFKEISELVK